MFFQLKRKEIQHLAKLTAEWKRKKSKMEKDLNEKMEKCISLQTTLEEAQKTIKVSKVLNILSP